MDQLRITILAWFASVKDALHSRGDVERGDVSGWVFVTLMAAALVALIWGAVSQRFVETFSYAMDSLPSI